MKCNLMLINRASNRVFVNCALKPSVTGSSNLKLHSRGMDGMSLGAGGR